MNIIKMPLQKSIPMMMVLLAVIAAVVTGATGYFMSRAALDTEASNKLEALAASRKHALDDYLGAIEQDVRSMAAHISTLEMLNAFKASWDKLGGDAQTKLQKLYITDNPNPTGQKENLDAASDGSEYSIVHQKYHPSVRKFLRERDYYDIFVFDLEGNLLYTVFKELDYATNLMTGEWKDSGLGKVYRAARDNTKEDFLAFGDFAAYAPSNGVPASFIATSIRNENGDVAGVLAFQMPIARINSIMQQKAGMGETGETYIVGSDLLMRSDSRFSEESTILKTKVDSATVKQALAGNSGVRVVPDYRNIPVYSAYEPLTYNGTKLAVIAEIDESEVLQPVHSLRNLILALVAAVIMMAVIIGIWFGKALTAPLTKAVSAMTELANGNLDVKIDVLKRENAVGRISRALAEFRDKLVANKEMEEQQERERKEKEKRATFITEKTSEFDHSVTEIISSVTSAATQMEATATNMSGSATEAGEKCNAVAAASEQASANVQTVATAAEELSATIREISQQVTQANNISTSAVSETKGAAEKVQGLARSAKDIGDVLSLISDIADQTNLLALNATIEAARAGDAGKGFAVVASEVKNLANQTAKATEEISGQIGGIQNATEDTVRAIEGIGRVVNKVNEISTAIAAAIEEQGAATQEIARNVEQASSGTQEVSANIADVSTATTQTGQMSGEVQEAAGQLSAQADVLRRQVEQFLGDIKSA
jgi:methyl-accepting chemotaxis protein